MEFIGRIYCVFESLFGQQLGEYLWGYNCETDDYTNPVLFPRIAFCFDWCAILLCHKQCTFSSLVELVDYDVLQWCVVLFLCLLVDKGRL